MRLYKHVHKPRAWLWKDEEYHVSPFDRLTLSFLEAERATAGHGLLLEAGFVEAMEGKEFNWAMVGGRRSPFLTHRAGSFCMQHTTYNIGEKGQSWV